MHVSGLFIYPVKSLRGVPVASAEVDALGFVGDRRFLVVDEAGRHLTQRQLPRMALISADLTATALVLHADNTGSISVPLHGSDPSELRSVSIWRSHGLLAEDCGDRPAAWLSDFLGAHCRLVRAGQQFRRPVLQKPFPGLNLPSDPSVPMIEGRIVTSDLLHFGDGYPFLITSEASLADLNDRLLEQGEEPVPMNRFRPNIVISGSTAFAEDTWPRVRIGPLIFRAGGPSSRCIMTTTDQLTGDRRGAEPLRTLATYRRDARNPGDVNFGQNFIHESKSGALQVGDRLEILPTPSPTR